MTPLRQRMLEDMQVRNLSPHTQRAYVENVSKFARHFGRSPTVLGPDEIRAYLVHLTTEKQLAPSSVVIAVCALRFLYKVTLQKAWTFEDVIPAPKKPRPLPVVLSPDEVRQLLDCVPTLEHRAILTTCYATGLRISETLHLRPTDIDSRRMVIRVEQGKGQLDRYVMLAPTLLDLLVDRPTLEVADIFRRYGDTYRDQVGPSLSTGQRRVMAAIEQCRTAALGGHIEQCDACARQRIAYNSCANRHCPTCQSLARAAWVEQRTADVLDCEYFHVVFTVPAAIAAIALQNKAVVYRLCGRPGGACPIAGVMLTCPF